MARYPSRGTPRSLALRAVFQILARLGREDQDAVIAAVRAVFALADEMEREGR